MSGSGTAARRIVVYSRQGCELCEEMIAELEFSAHIGLRAFTVVDIDTDRQLVEKFGVDVPVLTIDGRVVCQHRLDEPLVLSGLEKD